MPDPNLDILLVEDEDSESAFVGVGAPGVADPVEGVIATASSVIVLHADVEADSIGPRRPAHRGPRDIEGVKRELG